MSNKNFSHWGWDILMGVLPLIIWFIVRSDLSDPLKEYYRGGTLFLSSTFFFGGIFLVYLLLLLFMLYTWIDAFCKIKNIKLHKPTGIARVAWVCLRMGFIAILLIVFKNRIACSSLFVEDYKTLIIGTFAPLVVLMLFMRTKNPIVPFLVIILGVVIASSVCLISISRRELKKESTRTKGIITNIVLEKSVYHNLLYKCRIDYRYNGQDNMWVDKSISGAKALQLQKLSVGDTIIIAYSPKCENIRKVINMFPSSSEAEK